MVHGYEGCLHGLGWYNVQFLYSRELVDGHLVSILILPFGLLFCVHCHRFELDIIYMKF